MTLRFESRARLAACAVVASLAICAPALAQQNEGESEAEASAPQGRPAQVAATTPQPAPVPAVGLELLPSSGYPAPRVRGIEGGSLWMTMQGWQFPYMPRLAGAPSTRIAFSGMVWSDASYRKVDSGIAATDPSVREQRQQSRLVLRATPTFNADNNWFVQGQGELALIGAAPTLSTEFINADDLFVRIGRWNVFDVTVGRFQGWEVYHFGMGLDLNTVERNGAITENNTPVGIYGLTFLWDRPNGPGYVATHVYPTDYLRFEILGEYGSSSVNQLGVRPVGILDLGIIKVKAGAEYERQSPRQQSPDRMDEVLNRGLGGAVQVVLDPRIEAGVNFARSIVDLRNAQGVLDPAKSTTTYSVGGFANARLLGPLIAGAGVNYTKETDTKANTVTGDNDLRTHLQAFGALQYVLWDRFYIKAVVAYADARFAPLASPPPIADYHNKMLSGRLRFMYLF
jgi:hypothetical protein